MKQQIIQCPTSAQMRKEGFCGTTWIITQSPHHPKEVFVQHSICAPEDQFSRKKGVYHASMKPEQWVRKQDLLDYVERTLGHKGGYCTPSVYEIYRAVVRL